MMIHKDFISNFNDLLGELSALGYCHRYGVLNSSDYGVAQSRRRLFVISKLGEIPPELPKPFLLAKCLADYLDPDPVPDKYFLKDERVENLLWSTSKQRERGNGFAFRPTDPKGIAKTVTSKAGGRKTDNFLLSWRRDHE